MYKSLILNTNNRIRRSTFFYSNGARYNDRARIITISVGITLIVYSLFFIFRYRGSFTFFYKVVVKTINFDGIVG